jgi:hypothetical protein
MFFAKKFCHCWRAADFAFAFAHHFYLPPALPRHFAPRLPGFAFKQRWFLHQRINSYNVVTWPLTAGSHWRCFWIGGRRRNLHSFFIRLGARASAQECKRHKKRDSVNHCASSYMWR